MKTLKRFFAVLLALVLVCTGLPLAFAEDDPAQVVASGTDGNVTWELNSAGTLTLTGIGEMNNYTRTGTSVNGVYVEYSGAPWGQYYEAIRTVVIGNGLTSIGQYAFYECCNLIRVDFGNSVTSIGNSAFCRCDSLKSIELPDSVTTIGNSAFSSDDALTSVSLGNSVTSIGYCALSSCSSLVSVFVDPDNPCYYSDEFGCLYNKDKTTLIQYPIGNARTSFVVPETVKTIERKAFSACSSLKSIDLGNNVTAINDNTFSYCTSLESIAIPDSVTSIGYGAFSNCYLLKSVDLGNGVTMIEQNAFYHCSGLESIVIPDSVTTMGPNIPPMYFDFEGVFNGCSNLKTVVTGNGLTAINPTTFYNCSMLETVVLGTNVTSIGMDAFHNCTSLRSVIDYGKIQQVDYAAFDTRNLPASLTVYCSQTSGLYNYAVSHGIATADLSEVTSPDISVKMTSAGQNYFSGSYAKDAVEIVVTANHSSENTVYLYSLDGAAFTEFDGTLTVSDDGDYTYEFTARNAFGQLCENSITCNIIIDKTAPVIQSVTGNATDWVTEVTLRVDAADERSGVQGFSFDGGQTWVSGYQSAYSTKAYTANCTIPAGTIQVRDHAGNCAVWNKAITIDHIDCQAPEIENIRFSTKEITRQPVVLTIESHDIGGELDAQPYSFDWGCTWQADPSKSFARNTRLPAGSIRVRDKAGNTVSWNEEVAIENILENNLIVTVVDTAGNTVSDANVYIHFGNEGQYVVRSDSNGQVKQFINANQITVGVLKNGYLPAVQTVSLSNYSATEVTIEIEEKELVQGDFDIRRMTEEELVEAGIDLDDPENQYACRVRVDFVFTPGGNEPDEQTPGSEYHFNDVITFSGVGGTYVLPPTVDGKEVILYTPFEHHHGPDNPSDPSDPGSGTDHDETFRFAYVLIIDVPIKAACAKEFFNVNLTMINQAASEFNVRENELQLTVPEGLTLMENLDGFENEIITFDSFSGQETKEFSWLIRGDKEGTYNIGARYTGILDGFEAQYDCEFVSDQLTVYGMSNLTMVINADNYILNRAWRIRVGLRNDSDIDVVRPEIHIEEDLLRAYEAFCFDEDNGIVTAAPYTQPTLILQNYFEMAAGSNQRAKIDAFPSVLKPGHTVGVSYVMRDISSANTFADFDTYSSFLDYFVREESGYELKDIEVTFDNHGGTVYTYEQGIRSFAHPLEYYISQTSSDVYNPNLANVLMWFATSAYIGENDSWTLSEKKPIENTYDSFGFNDENNGTYKAYEYEKPASESTYCAYSIGNQELPDGRTLVMITVRGTGNQLSLCGEWLGNAQVFNTDLLDGYGWHHNFEACARKIFEKLEARNLLNSSDDFVYCLTGHSKGGAVANLTSMLLQNYGVKKENLYDYNFACPDVAVENSDAWNNHNNMFNINNVNDLVPYVPALLCNHLITTGGLNQRTSWGKFGVSRWFSLNWTDTSAVSLLAFLGNHFPDKYIRERLKRYEPVEALNPPTTSHRIKFADSYSPHDPLVYLAFTEQQIDLGSMVNRTIAEAASGEALSSAAATVIETSPAGQLLNGAVFIFSIMCPVDFTITDKDGNTIVSCVDNIPVYAKESDAVVTVFVDGDRKTVLLANPDEYTVHLTATDNGKMSFKVEHLYNEFLHEPFDCSYSDISLTPDKKMSYTFNNTEDLSLNNLYVVDENDLHTARIENDGNETPIHCYNAADDAAHSWNDGEIVIAATCEDTGNRLFTCTNCGATKAEPIPALGHAYGAWTLLKEPSCQEEGVEQRVCENDESHVETRTLSVVDHLDADNDGYCDACGEKMTGGDHCAYCGKIHNGFFGWFVRFFHKIFALFKR